MLLGSYQLRLMAIALVASALLLASYGSFGTSNADFNLACSLLKNFVQVPLRLKL